MGADRELVNMRGALLIASAGLLAAGAWVLYRSQDDAEPAPEGEGLGAAADAVLTDAGQGAAELFDTLTGGTLKLSNMARVTAEDVRHPNVRALLAVIRRGEGTADNNGFRRLFGGELFTGFADHPRRAVTRTSGGRRITSTAAGAFQFLASTWDETARLMGLADFSPANQERAAVGRIAARGALEDVKAGRLDLAVSKIAREWASLPGSPYGQPVITWDAARLAYASAGGTVTV